MPSFQERLDQQLRGNVDPAPGPAAPTAPSERRSGGSFQERLNRRLQPEDEAAPQVRRPPPRPLPTNLYEEVTEFPRLWASASRTHWDEMVKAAKDTWKHDTFLGHVGNILKTAGEAGMYVASPVEAVIETVAEPVESFGAPLIASALTGGLSSGQPLKRIPGLAHGIGEAGSIGAQFLMDPLAAAGYATGLGKAATALREGPIGRVTERTFSAATRTERVPKMIEDPLTGEQLIQTQVTKRGVVPIMERRPYARDVEAIRIKKLTEEAITNERTRADLDIFQKAVRSLDHDQRMEFNYWMDGDPAATLPTGMQPVADELRRLIDEGERRLVSIKALARASGTYWPRLFRDKYADEVETGVAAFQARQAEAAPRGGLRSSKRASGLLKRTVPTMRESIDNGWELVTDNPLDLAMLRLQGVNHFYYGTLIGNEIKKLPYVIFKPWNKEFEAAKLGYRALEDKFMEARLPPASVDKKLSLEVKHSASFDPSLRKGIDDVARLLGVSVERPLRAEDVYLTNHPLTRGYAQKPYHAIEPGMPVGTRAVSEFGNQEAVMMHEIGHHIEFEYKLADAMQTQNPAAWEELKDLALLRSSDPNIQANDPAYYAYLIDKDERIANFFHAYWHAPNLLKSVASKADRFVRNWLKEPAQNGLRGVVDSVKPSLRGGSESRVQKLEEAFTKTFPGIRYLGRWYAPETVATVFNNYVNPSRLNTDFTNIVRGIGNFLNMMQLSFSAFHYGMVSIDSAVSAASQMKTALSRGQLGRAASIAATQVPLAGPVYSGVRQVVKGTRLRREILDPSGPSPLLREILDPRGATPELLRIMGGFERSGGRINMDMIHRSSGLGGFSKSIRGGYLWDSMKDTFKNVQSNSPTAKAVIGGAKLGARLVETSMEPIMTYYVPRVKLGVFHDMAGNWIAANPGASEGEFTLGMQKIWDSIDNRMGEMVYDDLSWNKTLKDLAFIAVRAVGWNLGTQRELGGGILDAIKAGHVALTNTGVAEITERTKYSMALPVTVAIQGAMLNWLYTGKPPSDLLDYFYPRNGRMTKDGAPERISLPSYVKDVFAYNNDPMGTVLAKLHPLWESMYELYENKDYYGADIRSPLDPTWQPIQVGKYALHQLEPFSWRGFQRQQAEHADLFPKIMSAFGFVPAPVSIVNPKKMERYQQMQDVKGFRRRMREQLRGQ